MAWAGPSHWRFKAAPKAAGIDKGIGFVVCGLHPVSALDLTLKAPF